MAYIREAGTRGLSLDRVALLAVDHAEGTEVAVTPTDSILAGVRVSPTGVMDGTGRDVTPAASGQGAEPVYADSSATLFVDLPAFSGSGVDCALLELGAGSVGGGGVAVDGMAGDSSWSELTIVHPRRDWSLQAVPLAGAIRLRLRFRDAIAVRFVGRFGEAGPASVRVAELTAAASSGGHVWTDELKQSDGRHAIATPGDTLSLAFLEVPNSDVFRSWFMLLEGEPLSPEAAIFRMREARQDPGARPGAFRLHQNTPNPFANSTRIAYELPVRCDVRLEIFDLQGRVVKSVSGLREAGIHAFDWDLRDTRGRAVAPGIYAYRLRAGGFSAKRKLVVVSR